ncbi:MAG TPA: EAL domain-containing protein [Longimicrobiales bacterium]|nr:EAL domain-containing protein [Longimicrobiales bacterium]
MVEASPQEEREPTVPEAADRARLLALEESRERAETARREIVAVLDRITDGFFALDRDWRVTYVNRRAEELLALEPGTLFGQRFWTRFPEAYDSIFGREYRRAMAEMAPVYFAARSVVVDRWFSVHAYPSPEGLSVYFQDVTEKRRAEEALRESERRYRSLFHDARDAIYITSRSGRFLDVNASMEALAGYERAELLEMSAVSLYARAEDRERFRREIEARGSVHGFEVRLRRNDGAEIDCLLNSVVRLDADGRVAGYQGIIHDITDRKRAEESLRHDALHDPLTGLPNRALFMRRLERALARAARDPAYHFAVLFLDLDRFKVVNDSLGHLAGDELLVGVARRLDESVRPGDTVARLGGDEFAILLHEIEEVEDADRLAERIHERLREPHALGGQTVFTTASVGLALGSAEYERPEELLRDADTAMYRAKQLGGVQHQVFDHTMHAEAMALLHLETDLRRAVEEEEFDVFYQPIVSLDTGALVGLEALARWRHPTRGLVMPAEFISLAEETGLIVPLGRWVLDAACRRMAEWRARYPDARSLTLSVNLAAKQLSQRDLVEHIEELVETLGLAGVLRLEMTESALVANPDGAIAAFRRLRQAGVELCIDDFGTGYSSLSHLHRFPVDILKIDRSFVDRLGRDESNRQIVGAIVALAGALGIDAVAEGVETTQQRDQLRALGSRTAQGYLFSQPLPSTALEALLGEPRRER